MENESKNKETMEKTPKKSNKSKNVKISKFEDLEGKFLHIKVGNTESPANSEQIEEIESKIVGLLDENNVNCLVFVTHHAVSMEIIEKQINEV